MPVLRVGSRGNSPPLPPRAFPKYPPPQSTRNHQTVKASLFELHIKKSRVETWNLAPRPQGLSQSTLPNALQKGVSGGLPVLKLFSQDDHYIK